MKKFFSLLVKERWLRMNGKIMTLTFAELFKCIFKKLGQFFFHTYFIACLSKLHQLCQKLQIFVNKLVT